MDELRELTWEYAAGRTHPEDLPMAAALALARGIDSSALRELAGLGRRSDTVEIHSLFARALGELELPSPSFDQAARRDLHRLARELIAGRATAREITRTCDPTAGWMTSTESKFVGECCYYDDMLEFAPADRAPGLEAALMEAAHAINSSETGS